ncbi:MAG: RcnB family protein [Steroidobacteraceae bacterium]
MKRLAASTLILALVAGNAALADPPRHGGFEPQHQAGHDWQGRDRGDRRDGRDVRGGRDGRDWRDGQGWYNGRTRPEQRGGYEGRYGYNGGYYGPRYGYPSPSWRYDYRPRGYYGHRWARGQWLPAEYRTRYYYVPDYWRYGQRVYAPPVGCRWVRYDGDLVLTALATGLVLDVIYDAYD